jgi:hypothetical protein
MTRRAHTTRISAEASQDAEYEAIHAEIVATERGRWFLSEHVKRNRAANTDRLVDSLARAEAALRGGAVAAMPNPFADDLAQLAAAIGQVEAVIAAGGATAAGGLAASGRIQDIGFALREREIDTVLCEALESALFELGEAFAQHDAAAERAQSAAALLRGLQASISAMIALAAPSSAAEPARVPELASEVQAGSVTPEAAAPASPAEESPSMESAPPDSAGGLRANGRRTQRRKPRCQRPRSSRRTKSAWNMSAAPRSLRTNRWRAKRFCSGCPARWVRNHRARRRAAKRQRASSNR